MEYSQIKMRMRPDQVKAFDLCEAISKGHDVTMGFMNDLGISFDEADEGVKALTAIAQDVAAQDAAETQTAGTIAAGVQFLQHFLPKTITVLTQKRVIDDLIGRTIAGEWHDEEIVQPIVEHTGTVTEYSDNADFRLANFNPTFAKRTIVRFEGGLQTGKLEEARIAAMKLRTSAYDAKRAAVGLAFAINTNDIGFYGWNNGNNRTYGILNETGLEAYQNFANGSSGSAAWSGKTYDEICRDIRTAVARLRVNTGDNFDPATDKFTIGVASACVDFLDTQNALGNKSVRQWIKDTYPKSRIVSVPQFNAANGNANVVYFIMDSINGEPVIDQYVAATMRLLGTEKRAKGIREDYTNACAGVLAAHAEGIVRYSGC